MVTFSKLNKIKILGAFGALKKQHTESYILKFKKRHNFHCMLMSKEVCEMAERHLDKHQNQKS